MNSIPTFFAASISSFDWNNISDVYPVSKKILWIPFRDDSNDSGLVRSSRSEDLPSFNHFSFVFFVACTVDYFYVLFVRF